MKVTIAKGYHGMCNVCSKDVFDDNGILGWVEFLKEDVSTAEDIKINEAMEAMGLPMPTGCWAAYHQDCIPLDMETKGVNK